MDTPLYVRNDPTVNGYPVQRKPIVHIPAKSTRAASASKIQKVFREFVARKSINRVMSVAREVDEIERRVSRSETVELLRGDERERIRVNEALMSLLFKLDSVRGVDSGVRVCRKAVTRRAIALQDRIDAIVNSNQLIAAKVCDFPDSEQPRSVDSSESVLAQIDGGNKAHGVEEPELGDERNDEGENQRNREMVEVNGKMMRLMTQLLEMNEAQTRMLHALTQRVEHLEEAYMKKKKKKRKIRHM